MIRILLLVLLAMARPPKPPKPKPTKRCLSCDAGVHHPGLKVAGCECGTCQGGTG